MPDSCSCEKCNKKVSEHLASLLPFRVLEDLADRPLRIGGVALVVGMSRNFNVYTPEELQAFAEKLVNSPVYMEHVTASDAIGKTTKTSFDAQTRCLLYEAEIYDTAVAEKIRKGLIQHVSVGADYQTIDLVNAKVPHGLYNAELSLVAVPGVPEANIQILERLAHMHTSVPASGKEHKAVKVIHEKLTAKELLQDLQCVFCGGPGDYLVSTCTACGDRAAGLTQAVVEFLAGFDPAKGDGDFSSLVLFERVGGRFVFRTHSGNGVESMEEKDIAELTDKIAAKVNEKLSQDNQGLKEKVTNTERQLGEANTKLSEANGKVAAAEGARDSAKTELATANKLLEKYRKVAPGVELLAAPPVLMPVSEAVAVIREALPPSNVQRSWGLGPQRMCQELNRGILKLERRVK